MERDKTASVNFHYDFGFFRLASTSMENGPARYNLSSKGALLWIQDSNHLHLTSQFVEHVYVLILMIIGGLVVWLIMGNRVIDSRGDMALGALCTVLFSPLVEGTHLMLLVVTSVMTFSIWWDDRAAKGRSNQLGTLSGSCCLAVPQSFCPRNAHSQQPVSSMYDM